MERGSEPELNAGFSPETTGAIRMVSPSTSAIDGSANLCFDGPSLHVEYRDLNCDLLSQRPGGAIFKPAR